MSKSIEKNLDKMLEKASDNRRVADDRGVLAVKASEMLSAANFDMGVAAKGLVTAIAKKAEVDECFQPKDRQGGGYSHDRLEECLAA
eukprot:CAMPEP_0114115932 /NCGR_PEP_ID=MMETSP0043_2-20121206/4231_1 /TAXON_ID=464988 /ORGANISM="Hemiselmis andersenii, Strain CCMP644" /LENGTH=86 /DNA_ID=CAMNT_0001208225 /DNA_START=10 /DNA_END=267 /DNA_ORIENTATION=-